MAKSDIEIAREATLKPITEIAQSLDIPTSAIKPFGHDKAKLTTEFVNSVKANQDQFAILVAFDRVNKLGGQLCLIVSEWLNCFRRNIELLRDFDDRFQGRFTSNFDITFNHFSLQIVGINCTLRACAPEYLRVGKLKAGRVSPHRILGAASMGKYR